MNLIVQSIYGHGVEGRGKTIFFFFLFYKKKIGFLIFFLILKFL